MNTIYLKGEHLTSTTVNEPDLLEESSKTPMSEALPNTNIESAADFEVNELYLATNSAPGDGDEYFSEMIIERDHQEIDSIVDVSPAAAEREVEV